MRSAPISGPDAYEGRIKYREEACQGLREPQVSRCITFFAQVLKM